MTISERTETFAGKTVRDYEGGEVAATPGTVDRLALEYDDERSMGSLVEEYLSEVDKRELEALVIGMWTEPHDTGPADALDVLVQHASELPKFKALFVGDMT